MARIEHYDIGDLWTPKMTWMVDANKDGVPETPTDPSQIVIRQQTPAGVESVVTTASSPATLTSASTPLARLSTGVFQLSPGISLSSAGYWFVRAEGTGAAQASEEFQAIVDPSQFTAEAGLSTRALVSLAEAKDWLNQQNINTAEDLELVRVINDVSDRIHAEAGREFVVSGTNPQTRSFSVECATRVIPVGDLAALTTASPVVSVIGSDWTSTVFTVAAANVRGLPLVRESWQPITQIELNQSAGYVSPGMRVDVSGTWGFPAVPGNIRQAALDTIASIMDRDVEHYRQDLGSVSQGGETGNVVVLASSTPMFLSLPPGAFAAVRSYRQPQVG